LFKQLFSITRQTALHTADLVLVLMLLILLWVYCLLFSCWWMLHVTRTLFLCRWSSLSAGRSCHLIATAWRHQTTGLSLKRRYACQL